MVETPEWSYGGRVEVDVHPFRVGVQAKHVGPRWATDVNDVKVTGYTVVDADARLGLDQLLGKKSYFQLNITNLLGYDEPIYSGLFVQAVGTTSINIPYGKKDVWPRAINATVTLRF